MAKGYSGSLTSAIIAAACDEHWKQIMRHVSGEISVDFFPVQAADETDFLILDD
jgi:hypothetical protein